LGIRNLSEKRKREQARAPYKAPIEMDRDQQPLLQSTGSIYRSSNQERCSTAGAQHKVGLIFQAPSRTVA